jgi:hypothetical protein
MKPKRGRRAKEIQKRKDAALLDLAEGEENITAFAKRIAALDGSPHGKKYKSIRVKIHALLKKRAAGKI